MVIFEGALGLGIGFLLAVALAQHAKIKSGKGMQLIAVAGVLLLLSAAWGITAVGTYLGTQINLLKEVFELLAWLFVLIGAIFVAYETLLEIF